MVITLPVDELRKTALHDESTTVLPDLNLTVNGDTQTFTVIKPASSLVIIINSHGQVDLRKPFTVKTCLLRHPLKDSLLIDPMTHTFSFQSGLIGRRRVTAASCLDLPSSQTAILFYRYEKSISANRGISQRQQRPRTPVAPPAGAPRVPGPAAGGVRVQYLGPLDQLHYIDEWQYDIVNYNAFQLWTQDNHPGPEYSAIYVPFVHLVHAIHVHQGPPSQYTYSADFNYYFQQTDFHWSASRRTDLLTHAVKYVTWTTGNNTNILQELTQFTPALAR